MADDAPDAPAPVEGGSPEGKKKNRAEEKAARAAQRAAAAAAKQAASEAEIKGPDLSMLTLDDHDHGNLFIESHARSERTFTKARARATPSARRARRARRAPRTRLGTGGRAEPRAR